MNKNTKITGIAFLLIWLVIMALDQFDLIPWPDTRIKRIFLWTPTVVFGLYFLFFGGKTKENKK